VVVLDEASLLWLMEKRYAYFGLFSSDSVNGEATLHVIKNAEVLPGLFDVDDIHESRGEGAVGADLSVNLDQALHQNALDFSVVQGILQAVAEEDDQRKTFTGFVGTRGGLGSENSGKLIQHP